MIPLAGKTTETHAHVQNGVSQCYTGIDEWASDGKLSSAFPFRKTGPDSLVHES